MPTALSHLARLLTLLAAIAGVWTDTDKDGVVDAGEVSVQTHAIDQRGALTGLDNGSAVEPVGQDLSGAVTQLHGRNIYHDWLGRPVLVTNTSNGNPVAAYAYDGFGRLAKRTAPWPNNASLQRIESYFYDGVRRIQEVFTDPVQGTAPWAPPPVFGDPPPPQTPETRTEAEYIWSATAGQPFDTCHVQIDWWDREAWFVQDHQTGTVRAYTDPSGEIVEQYGFDAFGNLIRRDEFTLVKSGSQGYFNTFRQRLGHQGLFADRLQGHTNQRVMATGIDMWYQSRSRWYAPELGRFITADPNGTGVTIQSSLAKLGMMPAGPPHGSFEWDSHYGDGWDVFTAYGANPVQTQDPTGLFGFFSLLMTGFDMAEGAQSAMDMAAFGVSQQMRVAELWTGYAMGQMAMFDAISDWSSSDPYLEARDYYQGGIMSAQALGMLSVFAAEFLDRNHGGKDGVHNREIDRLARQQMETGKYSKALKNRGLVNAQGRTILGGVRPDIQLIRADGSGVDIIEVDYTSKHDPNGMRARIIKTLQAESGVRGYYKTWDIDVKTGSGRWR